MSETENVEVVHSGYAALVAGDMEAFASNLAPDVSWHIAGESGISGDYEGPDGVKQFFGRLMEETGGTFRLNVHDVLGNEEHTVSLVHYGAERGGKRLDQNVVHVYHLNSENKITDFWSFPQDHRALEDFWA